MKKIDTIRRATLGTALAAALAAGLAVTAPVRALAQPAGAEAPTSEITLSVGNGRLMRLDAPITDLFVANEGVADVQVRSPTQLYIFGKAAGSTTLYATDRAGRVVYSATVRVGQNLASVGDLLDLAMPEADIRATPLNGMVLLTGTVAQPADAEEAERLVQSYVGEGTQVVSRLRTATPQQVMLQVRIAEVSRSLVRQIGTNLLSRDTSGGGFLFGIGRGNPGTITPITSPTMNDPFGNPLEVGNRVTFNNPAGTTTLGAFGRLFGLNILGSVNANEQNGLITILAEPTLTALSGETASFLAGGEFPIPVSQSLGAVTIEYKQYGVGLAFSPIVLENGRISMRVRPEVSELSSEGSIRLNDFEVPALITRRAETTVELGSGQSFMIAGLLRNSGNNSVDRTPFLGSLPIIGALFRSTSFRRSETELVIIVTPYLVRPVSASQIALPTDGFRNANEAQRLMLGQDHSSRPGEQRPMPRAQQPQTAGPSIEVGSAAPPPVPAPAIPAVVPAQAPQRPATIAAASATSSPQPGFDF
ncbi:MAG TPA: type II and III secretion system protein family protein [Allosphingosinicella sp.]|jgi:pilus assembly protein CpaC